MAIYHPILAKLPPSTGNSTPVMNDASSEARKTAAKAPRKRGKAKAKAKSNAKAKTATRRTRASGMVEAALAAFAHHDLIDRLARSQGDVPVGAAEHAVVEEGDLLGHEERARTALHFEAEIRRVRAGRRGDARLREDLDREVAVASARSQDENAIVGVLSALGLTGRHQMLPPPAASPRSRRKSASR